MRSSHHQSLYLLFWLPFTLLMFYLFRMFYFYFTFLVCFFMQKPNSVHYISSNNGLQHMQMIIFFIVIFCWEIYRPKQWAIPTGLPVTKPVACASFYMILFHDLWVRKFLFHPLNKSFFHPRCSSRVATRRSLSPSAPITLAVWDSFLLPQRKKKQKKKKKKKREADLCRCPRRRQVVYSAALWQMSCVRDNFAGRRAGLKGEDDLGACLWLCAVVNAAGDIWKELLH